MDYILAYDFGTGGIKASLFNGDGKNIASGFDAYATYYPSEGFHEQSPEDWWRATVASTRNLIERLSPDQIAQIKAIGISGHSLGVVPLDASGKLLRDKVPIWSDSRAWKEAEDFFKRANVSEEAWYSRTGCGFPPGLYSVFKLMWFASHEPEWFDKVDVVLGTKDYINFKLTGVKATDNSYASGSGVYDLVKREYVKEWISASGLRESVFPQIVPSTHVLGSLTEEAAEELGIPGNVQVVAGGVDNSCMALGASAYREGRVYNSLGSSSWIALSSSVPVIDVKYRPYVFDHVVPDQYASALAIFSAGTSHTWLRDVLFEKGEDVYAKMDELAAESGIGANGLIFNPTLAGGSSLDATPKMRGGFANLDLRHTRGDMIRAVMEGVAFGLRNALDVLRGLVEVNEPLILVGGGAKAPLWRQIYADVYGMEVARSGIGQQAAALGAAVVAGVGCGVWKSFDVMESFSDINEISKPDAKAKEIYQKNYLKYISLTRHLGEWAKEFENK